jgi:hypothetical protein
MTARAAAAPGLAPASQPRREIPRQDDDYTAAAARRRLAFLAETTGAAPEHLGRYSFDPAVLDGNIECARLDATASEVRSDAIDKRRGGEDSEYGHGDWMGPARPSA